MDKFVFFGTPRFAEIFLMGIMEKGFSPSLVVTNPDRPAGRKKELTPPPVKILAEKRGIPILQPDKLSVGFDSKGAEFGIVSAYGGIIPKVAIEAFPKGIIGVHPSLLPLLRGATPIQTALLEGKTETGVSLFLLDEKADHGPIINEKQAIIDENDDYLSLEEKLAESGAELFVETIEKYLSGEIAPETQDESKATFTKKFSREDAFVHPETLAAAERGEDAFLVSRKIKAFVAEPGAWTIKNGKQMKLLECAVLEGKLILKKIQTEGKNPQTL